MKIVTTLLIFASLIFPVYSQTTSQAISDSTKETINKIGKNGRIKRLILKEGTKLKGHIMEIKADSFVLVDGYRVVGSRVEAVDRSNSAREIRFDEVREIKPYKGNVGGAVAVTGILVAVVAGGIYLIGRVALRD